MQPFLPLPPLPPPRNPEIIYPRENRPSALDVSPLPTEAQNDFVQQMEPELDALVVAPASAPASAPAPASASPPNPESDSNSKDPQTKKPHKKQQCKKPSQYRKPFGVTAAKLGWEEDIERAIIDMDENQMSLREAAKKYGIAHSTLQRRRNGGLNRHDAHIKKQGALTIEEEHSFITYLEQVSKGLPVTKSMAIKQFALWAQLYCDKANVDRSIHLMEMMLKRHPQLTVVKARPDGDAAPDALPTIPTKRKAAPPSANPQAPGRPTKRRLSTGNIEPENEAVCADVRDLRNASHDTISSVLGMMDAELQKFKEKPDEILMRSEVMHELQTLLHDIKSEIFKLASLADETLAKAQMT